MLKIRGLTSGYDKMEVLHEINLDVKPNEIVAIIGPNGSGKSTVLKSIFNLCDIYSGDIVWREKNITKLKTYEKIYEGISFVPQGRQIFDDLTVNENLEMGAFMMNDQKLVETNIENIYDKFSFLKAKKNNYAGSLSGGQQQMLAIGRSLMQNPQLLLLDEPSLGLSPKAMKDLFREIREINKEGVSIIIVEQNAKQAVKIADRTYVLEEGRIALEGGKEIFKNRKVNKIYFG